jgi:CheY-like chemotaxis protein
MTPRTVLVVDDDDDIRDITQLAMELSGRWTVLTARGGEEALEQARLHTPDAVLLDVMMPGVDGPTTFRRMQEDSATEAIPVILLTAKVQVGHRQVWDDLAVAGVISKPFDPTALADEVEAILARRG